MSSAYSPVLHSHEGLWTLGIVFFIISFILMLAKKPKGQKITQMILRLLFVLIIITGVWLVIIWLPGMAFWVIIKGLFGLLIIAMMELILTKGKKGQPTGILWTLLIIGLIVVFYIGYGVLG